MDLEGEMDSSADLLAELCWGKSLIQSDSLEIEKSTNNVELIKFKEF
jgi:hypothetical protein